MDSDDEEDTKKPFSLRIQSPAQAAARAVQVQSFLNI